MAQFDTLKITAEKALADSIQRGTADFFVGAGVSMLSPSSLPSGPELRDLVVEHALSNLKANEFINIILNDPVFQKTVPELIFSDIYTICGDNVFDYISCYIGQSIPNSSHYRIAKLSMAGRAVTFSTNFDLLLEDAGTPDVHHLHGDINHPHKITALLADNRPQRTIYGPKSNGTELFVLGYSGKDPNILRFILEGNWQSIYWLHHPSDQGIRNRLSFIASRKNVFLVAADVHEFLKTQLVVLSEHQEIFRIRPKKIHREKPPPPDFKEAALISALLLYRCERYSDALKLIDCSITKQVSLFEKSDIRMIVYRAEIGRALEIDSLVSLKSLESVPDTSDPVLNIEIRNMKAVLQLDLKRYHDALTELENLIQLSESLGKKFDSRDRLTRMEAVFSNNLGLANFELHNFYDARKWFIRSIRIKNRIGNPVGRISSLLNLALTAYSAGDPKKGLLWELKAKKGVDEYHLYWRWSKYLWDLGNIFAAQSNRKRAIKSLEKGLKVAETHLPREESFILKLKQRLAVLCDLT